MQYGAIDMFLFRLFSFIKIQCSWNRFEIICSLNSGCMHVSQC